MVIKILSYNSVTTGESCIDGDSVMVVCRKKTDPKPSGFTDLFPKQVSIPNHHYHGPFLEGEELSFYVEGDRKPTPVDEEIISIIKDGMKTGMTPVDMAKAILKVFK